MKNIYCWAYTELFTTSRAKTDSLLNHFQKLCLHNNVLYTEPDGITESLSWSCPPKSSWVSLLTPESLILLVATTSSWNKFLGFSHLRCDLKSYNNTWTSELDAGQWTVDRQNISILHSPPQRELQLALVPSLAPWQEAGGKFSLESRLSLALAHLCHAGGASGAGGFQGVPRPGGGRIWRGRSSRNKPAGCRPLLNVVLKIGKDFKKTLLVRWGTIS